MPPRSTKAQGESKQGLIITLVFFILATLGLGVATYFGFAEQDKLTKEAKEAKNGEKTFKDDRDWYQFQTKMLYSYIGKTEGMEGVDTLGTQRDQFVKGSMKGGKDKEFVKKVLQDLDKRLGWNGNQAKETLEGTITKVNTDLANRSKQIVELTAALAKAKKETEAKNAELEAASAEYKKQLAEAKEKFKNDFVKSDKDIDKLREDFKTLSTKHTKDLEAAEQEKKKLLADVKTRDADIKFLKQRIKDQQDRILAFEVQHEKAPASMGTKWKIIRMDTRGLNPYINLGSSDHVNPQLTFTIHGLAADGRPNPKPKGTLEVVNVIGPHLSQTRVTSVKDRNRDPITEGDVIYNASWNPNLKKHVAIAGIVDLTGDGRDDLEEFMRSLKRQNIEVDAYLDPKEGTMQGKITFRTDFLILGEVSESNSGKLDERGEKIATGLKMMQEEAKKYGVQQKGLGAYLELIGYRLPHSTRMRKPSMYNPDRRPDQAPRLGGDRVPPPMPKGGGAPPAMPPDK